MAINEIENIPSSSIMFLLFVSLRNARVTKNAKHNFTKHSCLLTHSYYISQKLHDLLLLFENILRSRCSGKPV